MNDPLIEKDPLIDTVSDMSISQKRRMLIVGVLVVSLILIGIYAWSLFIANKKAVEKAGGAPIAKSADAKKTSKDKKAKPALTVVLAQAQQIDQPRELVVNGGVFPWQETSIGTQLSGLAIQSLNVDIGSQVRRGQVLAVLSSDVLKANLAVQLANIDSAKAKVEQARAEKARAQKIAGEGVLSAQQIEQYGFALTSALANLVSAQASADVLRVQIKQTQILAPDDGVISSRTASLGAVVSGGAELFKMVRQSRLEWRAELMASEVSQVNVGQMVSINQPDGGVIEARIRAKSPVTDPSTRKTWVYIDLPKHSQLQAGMYVQGRIVMGQSQVQAVPAEAVIYRDGFAYVFVVNTDLKVHQVKVKIDQVVNKNALIIEPNLIHENLVASGASFLNEGDVVAVAKSVEGK